MATICRGKAHDTAARSRVRPGRVGKTRAMTNDRDPGSPSVPQAPGASGPDDEKGYRGDIGVGDEQGDPRVGDEAATAARVAEIDEQVEQHERGAGGS